MKQEIQSQQSPITSLPPTKKFSNKLIAVVSLVLVTAVAGYVAFKANKSDISPIITQPTGNQVGQQDKNNEVSKKIVGPLTVEPLMPIIEMDQPSISYKNSIIQVSLDGISMPEGLQKQLSDIIIKSDSEIRSRKVDFPEDLFSILYKNDDRDFVLYRMTPTGTSCFPLGELGYSCDNIKLKILNTKNNSINLLADNLGNGRRDVLLDEKDNLIIVSTDSNYQIFNLSAPYSLIKSTPIGFSSLLLNEYMVSYNPKTFSFVIENILNNKKIDCVITNTDVTNTLKNNFDYSHLSLSPNGNKIILLNGDSKSFWNDLSNQWSSSSPDCFNNAKEEAEFPGIMGEWYADSAYFAYSDYGSSASVYDFGAQKQIFLMPWKNTIGVGYLNNSGYHDTASFDEKISKVIVVPGEKQISIYFEMPDGMRYLISNYTDESSTQAFYQLTQQYPVNGVSRDTSGKLANAGVPTTWVRVEKDTTDKNLYHLLVLDGYKVRQALDVSVQP